MKLAINLITRERPDLLIDTIRKTTANIRNPNTVFMVSVDEDDEATINALAGMKETITASVRPREDGLGDKWNRVLTDIPDADIYMPMCDDGPIVTRGFDDKIIEAASSIPDGIAVVWNHLENASFPGVTAVTKKLADKMGYIWPGYWPYWFCDHWLVDIGKYIDRCPFADVRVDCASNRPPTMGMREPDFWANFYDAAYLVRQNIAYDIITGDDFDEPKWRKSYLLRRFPIHDYYSRWINDQVRQGLAPQLAQVQMPPPEERYIRLKARALKMMEDWLPDLEAAAKAA